MEELLAYAVLLVAGFDEEEAFQACLDALFQAEPEDELLLELELRSKDTKDCVLHLLAGVNGAELWKNILGEALLGELKKYYGPDTDLEKFGRSLYRVWSCLPPEIREEDPFLIMSYASEPLSWGDEAQTRRIYEDLLGAYDPPAPGKEAPPPAEKKRPQEETKVRPLWRRLFLRRGT